ncbi:hypothetical protein CT19431_MP70059 [Cupriavidus taiwanensis]|nr:hypothetical protein CT19431_MP70059 [Cupriavidus taiwanensis]
MISVPIAAATHVATNTASLGIPASPRIDGLTKMMYAIVRNVVIPARISVRTSVWCSRSLNTRSISDGAAWAAAGVEVPGLEAGSGIDMNGLLVSYRVRGDRAPESVQVPERARPPAAHALNGLAYSVPPRPAPSRRARIGNMQKA